MRSQASSFDGRTTRRAQRAGRETGMATNKKKIFVTESMSQQGRALLKERDDVEMVEFPNMISAADFEAMLKAQAPVHGVALGGTGFGEPELEASKDKIGRASCRERV